MKNKTIILIGVAAVFITSFIAFRASSQNTSVPPPLNQAGEKKPGFNSLSSIELATMLENKDFFFVNVHIPQNEQIRGTDAFIAYDEIGIHLEKLPQNKDAKIVLYCRSGSMSDTAAQELAELGYTNVSSLSGGMNDWKQNGYEIYAR